MNIVLYFLSNYLIEFMGGMLVFGLLFRWSNYRKSLREDRYFSSFVSEIEKSLSEKQERDNVDIPEYIEELLASIKDKLPSRSVRRTKKGKDKGKSEYNSENVVSLREFISGEKGLFHAIALESTTLQSKYPPNYAELTERILEQDENWTKIFGILPIAPISRLNDILPSIFVVFGIFGTFIGISMALPEIANIDFSDLEKSGDVLTNFVLSVTFAMKTSIAGILFSVIMTMLNTLAPVRGLRNKTFKKLSKCFENIWITFHGHQNIEQGLYQAIPELISEVKEIRTQIDKQLKKAS
ncbi:hypothetical protein A9Q84_16015 [Halobacteriovorax marinus]|uniref:MotA/TolQ/ExbB proton channel domain-containing protein n=1 Tax=Halobacteriovorax marinus TaxID=97084 RepID=A0A1Y5FAK8_9BACT|nr:hypothetical protein A9Q84_16015 [Halobacteriovorax marinus]